MDAKDFQEIFDINGYDTEIRWTASYYPAQNGDKWEPSWDAGWEFEGCIEVMVMGDWYAVNEMSGNNNRTDIAVGRETMIEINRQIEKHMTGVM